LGAATYGGGGSSRGFAAYLGRLIVDPACLTRGGRDGRNGLSTTRRVADRSVNVCAWSPLSVSGCVVARCGR
jgi:hypothetical protein